ncbi:MAG: ATP-dependent helicase HrpB [Planctomycetota bacterium]
MSPLQPLPIDDLLPELRARLVEQPNLILEAPTGAGKTTRVPPLLARAFEGQVLLVEPRRLAARAAARRMAQEWPCDLGAEVGYAVRMDSRQGPRTRVLAVTPGILLRRLLADPFLDGVAAIVFDEFHERGLEADLALAVARQVQRDVRPDLRLVLMSATMDVGELARWLGEAVCLRSEGRSYPVEIGYQEARRETPLEEHVAQAVQKVHGETTGSLLVFLPGVGEIRKCEARLANAAQRAGVELCSLYGEMDPAAQDRLMVAGDTRRWILATNVAESSVTLPGIEAVIDSGLQRRMEQNAQTGLDHLVLTRISQASAAQRAGRAGRLGPGRCLRLWAAHEQNSHLPHDPPEVIRVDPAGAILWLLAFGERDPRTFGWWTPPHPAALDAALLLLERLGAWRPDQGLTEVGRQMADMPLHPRLARLLLEGARLGVGDRAALAAVLCSERSPYENRRGDSEHHSESDLLDAVEGLEAFRDHGSLGRGPAPLRSGPARQILRLADRLQHGLPKGPRPADRDEALLRAVAIAFRDRVARRRPGDRTRALMAGGRGVRIAPESSVHAAELFVCVEIVQGRGDNQARTLSRVDPTWYGPEALREAEQVIWDSRSSRVEAHKVELLDDLVLAEKPVPISDWQAALECLQAAARKAPEAALPRPDSTLAAWLERVRFLAVHLPELEWPTFDTDALIDAIAVVGMGLRSFAELREAPWIDVLRGQLNAEQRRALDSEAPSHLRTPRGREVRLVYEGAKAPVLAARIQDLFGLERTPRVARGRVGVVLHLLAPNGRPQQVTDDLESFWNTTYGVVRKELRRRYPKHDWPEDPRQGRSK